MTPAWLHGKLDGASKLFAFARHLRNWPAVWQAYRSRQRVSQLLFRNGLELQAGPRDQVITLFLEIFVHRCYLGRNFYRPRRGDTIVDLGANIGLFALQCQAYARGVRVHAFEPDPLTAEQLRVNVHENRLDAAVTIHPLAVLDHAGRINLQGGAEIPAGHQTTSVDGTGPSVECVPLEAALDRTGVEVIDFLKIDTEGAEVATLEGAGPSVWARLRRIGLEYHDQAGRDRLLRVLTANRFGCTTLEYPGFPHLGFIHASGPKV